MGRQEGRYSWRGQLTSNYVNDEHGHGSYFASSSSLATRGRWLWQEQRNIVFTPVLNCVLLDPSPVSRTRFDD